MFNSAPLFIKSSSTLVQLPANLSCSNASYTPSTAAVGHTAAAANFIPKPLLGLNINHVLLHASRHSILITAAQTPIASSHTAHNMLPSRSMALDPTTAWRAPLHAKPLCSRQVQCHSQGSACSYMHQSQFREPCSMRKEHTYIYIAFHAGQPLNTPCSSARRRFQKICRDQAPLGYPVNYVLSVELPWSILRDRKHLKGSFAAIRTAWLSRDFVALQLYIPDAETDCRHQLAD